MLKKSTIAAAVASASLLAAAGPALAATGHSSLVNGGAAGTSAANAYVGSLYAQDTTTNATFVTNIGTITCTVATGDGQITANGGAAFPVGGIGPDGYLSNIALTNAGAAPCSSSIASLGNPSATTVTNDTNGANPGKWAVKGDWAAGSPVITFLNPSVTVTLAGLACTYTAASISGAVNNTAQTLTFSAATTNRRLTKSAGPATCPSFGDFNGVYALSRTVTGAAPVYLTA